MLASSLCFHFSLAKTDSTWAVTTHGWNAVSICGPRLVAGSRGRGGFEEEVGSWPHTMLHCVLCTMLTSLDIVF